MDEMLALYHSALKIREDVKKCPSLPDCSTVRSEDAKHMIPNTLYLFLNVLIRGDGEVLEEDEETRRIVMSISQDIIYKVSKGKNVTPKHIGLGMAIHQATRSKHLVNLIHNSGHCISYDQVRRLDTSIARKSIEAFIQHGNVPIPINISKGKFFQFSADNIDIIEETLDETGSFHATQMVAFQRASANDDGSQQPCQLQLEKERSLSYSGDLHTLSTAPNSSTRTSKIYMDTDFDSLMEKHPNEETRLKDLAWVLARIFDESRSTVPSWTGFNQIVTDDKEKLTTVGYLPIINAPAHDKDTLWTVIMRCLQISHHLNPGQTTVLTLDEQLYSKAKELQWANSDACKGLFLRLGGFHIAKNFMVVIGKHYSDSGILETWVESSVFGENTCQNIMGAKCYNRSIRAHKLTFEALWHILWPSFICWAETKGIDEDKLKIHADQLIFCIANKNEDKTHSCLSNLEKEIGEVKIVDLLHEYSTVLSPTSSYWYNYMEMVSILLQFIRAERTGNWELHLSAFSQMLPWFAIYDHTNYTRWGSVYLTEARQLEHKHPDVFSQFMEGNFVVKTTTNSFNQVSTDQALEHVNSIGKIAGGLIGITRSDAARDRWCLTYNDRSRIVDETCAMLGVKHSAHTEYAPARRESGHSRVKRDVDDVTKLVCQLREFGVFTHKSPTILSVSSHDVSSQKITDALLSAFSRGKAKLKTFLQDRILSNKIGLHEKLQLSRSLTLKSIYETNKIAEKGLKTKEVRADRALFHRLLLAKDAGRDVNLRELLCHELSPVPLSIANTAGELHPTSKSSLATLLEMDHTYEDIPQTQKQTCTIIDGQALVQSIGKPSGAMTFGDLADVFIAAAMSNVKNFCSTRLDVVFDQYKETSIKDGTRCQRTGTTRTIRKEVDSRDVPLPTMWKPFISLSANKSDLVHFLSTELISKAQQLYPDVQVVTAGGYKDLLQVGHSQQLQDVQRLSADHEEADTRILIHAQDARKSGFERLVVCCRDTDVLVLLVHYAQDIGGEIWFKTGTSQKRRMIAVHEMDIHPVLRSCLPAFHAVTGCDTVSQFYGIGKKTAWKVFCSDGFLLSQLGRAPLTDKVIANAEEFICKLYCPGTTERDINGMRHCLFLKAVTDPGKLPPTRQCLIEHIKRAYYQSLVWYSSLLPIQDLPSPLGYGWSADDNMGLKPEVCVKDPIPVVCVEILHFKCKNCNTGRCSCRTHKMTCTSACGCSGKICGNPFTKTDETLDDDM